MSEEKEKLEDKKEVKKTKEKESKKNTTQETKEENKIDVKQGEEVNKKDKKRSEKGRYRIRYRMWEDVENRTFALRKFKNTREKMVLIVKQKKVPVMEITFKCNSVYNYESPWSLKFCEKLLWAMRYRKVKVLSINGDEWSVSVIAKIFKDVKAYAWRIPQKYRGCRGYIKVGDWVEIPGTGYGIEQAYVVDIVPTIQLGFYPTKEVRFRRKYSRERKLLTKRDYWREHKEFVKRNKERLREWRKKEEEKNRKLLEEARLRDLDENVEIVEIENEVKIVKEKVKKETKKKVENNKRNIQKKNTKNQNKKEVNKKSNTKENKNIKLKANKKGQV